MRRAQRSLRSARRRGPPARSRVTVRRAVAALRRSRESLCDIESTLGSLLAALRAAGPIVDDGSADRLRGATREAAHSIEALSGLRRRLARQV